METIKERIEKLAKAQKASESYVAPPKNLGIKKDVVKNQIKKINDQAQEQRVVAVEQDPIVVAEAQVRVAPVEHLYLRPGGGLSPVINNIEQKKLKSALKKGSAYPTAEEKGVREKSSKTLSFDLKRNIVVPPEVYPGEEKDLDGKEASGRSFKQIDYSGKLSADEKIQNFQKKVEMLAINDAAHDFALKYIPDYEQKHLRDKEEEKEFAKDYQKRMNEYKLSPSEDKSIKDKDKKRYRKEYRDAVLTGTLRDAIKDGGKYQKGYNDAYQEHYDGLKELYTKNMEGLAHSDCRQLYYAEHQVNSQAPVSYTRLSKEQMKHLRLVKENNPELSQVYKEQYKETNAALENKWRGKTKQDQQDKCLSCNIL